MELRQRSTLPLARSALLLAILIAAAALRLYNITWDSGTQPHPDERDTVAFKAPSIRWPQDTSVLLDPRQSPLNPFWDVNNQTYRAYTYGHFPLYTLVLAGSALHKLAPLAEGLQLSPAVVEFLRRANGSPGYAYLGRFLMAWADVATVYLVFLIARRLYGGWAGLLAAALSAFTVLQIQLAHFFAMDPVSTTFTLLAIYGALQMLDGRGVRAALVCGVGIGLAVASKFSALPVVAAPLVAGFLLARRGSASPPGQMRGQPVRLVALALAVSLVVFALTSPFVFLDWENFRQAVLDEQGGMVSGVRDLPFTRQYRNTPSYLYFIQQQLRWGMGWPLGILAFAGLGWALLRALGGRLRPGEWILLAWIVPYFGLTGLFLAKFMRYMVPVVPLFVVFGAGLVAWLWRQARQEAVEPGEAGLAETILPLSPRSTGSERLRAWLRPLALFLAFVALAGAVIWALAFTNGVYGTEHSWIIASRWVYQNVPDGSCIAREHWEEGFPVAWDEPEMNPGAHAYRQPVLPMYDEDTPQKYELIRDTLRNCDYVVLASNRLWRTIPRLPERYPMSTRYYEALFSGELGYTQIAAFETPPRLGPILIADQAADESFTVYDHPRPIIFRKTRELSDAEWEAVLGGTWQGATFGYVGPPTLLMRLRGGAHTPGFQDDGARDEAKKSLRLDRPVWELPVVSDWSWNVAANRSSLAAAIVWWAAVQAMAVLAFPLNFLLFHKLPDRGYALSKSLGLLLVSYGVWIVSGMGFAANRLPAILGMMIGLGGVSGWLVWRHRRAIYGWLGRRWGLALAGEIVFGLVFLFFVWTRLLNPDLWQPWQGGEKMIEIGFLHAIVKSASMPPYDPFFAGEYINYYYYGLFIVGTLVKLTGIQPTIAFNLAVPTLAALTAANVFSLAGNLVRAEGGRRGRVLGVGLLAVLLLVFIGNLDGMAQLLRYLAEISGSDFQSALPGLQTLVRGLIGFSRALGGVVVREYSYWDPTRVIPNTINEFPFFSFLFADLHPHMIGIPFTVFFLSLVYAWLRPAPTSRLSGLASPPGEGVPASGPGTWALESTEPLPGVFPPPDLAETEPKASFKGALVGEGLAEIADIKAKLSWGSFWRWLAIPFTLGALAVINTWDLPTYLGLMGAAFALKRFRARQERARQEALSPARGVILLLGLAGFSLALMATTYILYWPFFANYQAPAQGVGLVHDRTPLDLYLKVWGLFLFVIGSWLLVSLRQPHTRWSVLRSLSLLLRRWNVAPHLFEIHRALVDRERGGLGRMMGWLALVITMAIALALLGFTVPALLFPLVVMSFLLLLRWEVTAETAFLGLLAFTGLLVLLGIEFFFLRDFLGGGDYYRMNTLFKFFIQAWVMFSVAAAVLLGRLWLHSFQWSRLTMVAWQSTVAILLFSGLVYPALATRVRVKDRFPGERPAAGSLDGLAYMTVGRFEWPAGFPVELAYDYEAIRWLQDHVQGTPVIAEAKIGYYREMGMRVAAYTGLPSVTGGLHQDEQHYPADVGQRHADMDEFWKTLDPERAWALIEQYNIAYIYVGQVERNTYTDQSLQKFNTLATQGRLKVVYENDKTKIYQRVKGEG
ncbi:MAG: DUF2298 domain-containing protein [Anaerolineae bacterium]